MSSEGPTQPDRTLANRLVVAQLAAVILWSFFVLEYWLGLFDWIENYFDPFPWVFVALIALAVSLAAWLHDYRTPALTWRSAGALLAIVIACSLLAMGAGIVVDVGLQGANRCGIRFLPDTLPWDAVFRAIALAISVIWLLGFRTLASQKKQSWLLRGLILTAAACGFALALLGVVLFVLRRYVMPYPYSF